MPLDPAKVCKTSKKNPLRFKVIDSSPQRIFNGNLNKVKDRFLLFFSVLIKGITQAKIKTGGFSPDNIWLKFNYFRIYYMTAIHRDDGYRRIDACKGFHEKNCSIFIVSPSISNYPLTASPFVIIICLNYCIFEDNWNDKQNRSD